MTMEHRWALAEDTAVWWECAGCGSSMLSMTQPINQDGRMTVTAILSNGATIRRSKHARGIVSDCREQLARRLLTE